MPPDAPSPKPDGARTSSLSRPPHAFIFDMDGTLLDNMGFHTEAWMESIALLGHPPVDPITWEQRTSGVPNRTIFADMLGVEHADVPEWVERKEAAYRRVAEGQLRALDGLHAFLDRAETAGIKLALATGAGPENIVFNLGALGLTGRFDVIVGADDVTKGKPDPEVFLVAAARLGVDALNCVVFEDAPLGIEAAHRAGMRVVALTTMLPPTTLATLPGVAHTSADFQHLEPLRL
jgi:HAD superfamily hydrolase (TIGR01509 family)